MRVLFVNAAIDWGGGERWTITTARGLAGRGHAVRVLGGAGTELVRRAREAALPTGTLPFSFDYSPVTIGAALGEIRSFRPDVLLAHQPKDVRTAGVAARLAGVAVVHRNGFPLLRNAWRSRLTARLSDRILTNSERIRERYESFGWIDPARIDVVPNGVEALPFAGDRTAVRAAWGVSAGDLVALYAGRTTGTKRVEDLLDAFERLPASSRWRLVVAGTGSQHGALAARAAAPGLSDRVRILGFRTGVSRELGAADLAVLASSQEGMPNALLEAMAAGVPVASTPVGDVPFLLEHGGAGWLIPVGNPAAWVEELVRLEADPRALEVMGARGRTRVLEGFTLGAMLDGVERSLTAARAMRPSRARAPRPSPE